MRSIWKGTVSFGLVSIGVRLYAATEEKGVTFHQVRRSDASRIRYRRVAEADGEEVAYGDIAKGYPLPGGETVVLTDEDFAELPLPSAKVVDLLQFVPAEQIDPIYFARSYYLEPENSAVKPYVLLRDALVESGMAGLVKVAIRNREQLATLRVREGVIVLATMVWPDEVRAPDFAFLDEDVSLRAQERQMARSLIDSLAGDFDPEAYTDDYRAAVEAIIDAKVAGRQVVGPDDATPRADNVVDLMSALRASVDAAKRSRSSTAGAPAEKDTGAAEPVAKAPAKTATATRAVTKKAPTAKAPAAKGSAARASATGASSAKAPAKKAAGARAAGAKSPGAKGPVKDVPAKKTARKSA